MNPICFAIAATVLLAPGSPPESSSASLPTMPRIQCPTPAELAERVRDVLRRTHHLRLEERVEQGGIKPGGEAVVFRTMARVDVSMCPKRIRTEVCLPDERVPLFTLVDDGERVTQWTADEWYEEPSSTPALQRDAYVAVPRVEACLFGSFMSTWVGDASYKAEFFYDRMHDGSYIGLDSVEGRPCHVVVHERALDELLMIRDCFYVDVESYLVLRWKTNQTSYDHQGRIVQDITRIRTFHDCRTEPFTDDVFRAKPPAGARKVERPQSPRPGDAQAESGGKTIPPATP